ncbi:SusC/RagA family TonB-linked outer membrane protein [Pedobacter sp. MW01-1-1]|uniref:SusC/RagA family TonB-linked outer membrane protein n=1 Tax=Pedobacter sp. MW01-1-1 TaxID=3383027 RepID=UPI003FED636E
MTFKQCLDNQTIAKNSLKVKLTFIVLFAFILQASAISGYSQITLNEKSASIEHIIQKIKKQSGYDFFYSASILKESRPVSIQVKNVSVDEALSRVFENQNITFKLNDKTIILQQPSAEEKRSRDIIVSGRVVDENNKPVEGASVKIKNGKGRAIKTSKEGEFKLIANSENDIIVVTYVGYKPYEIKATTTLLTIKLVLEENKMEEVVISTGIFKKVDKSFTGSSLTVTREELQQFGNRNLLTSLRNIDPSFNIIESNSFGNNPNRMPEIQIRGNSSLPNVGELQDQTRVDLNTPLVILDGFQSTLQKLLDINENEVESITILKDAAATAIYGSRGANGVIVITTRAPKAGKLRVSYKGDLNIESPDLTDYTLLKAREKLDLELRAGYYNNARAEQDLPLKRYYNYLLNEVNSGVETDWLAIPLQTGVGQRHNLRLEGGDQAFRYSASAQVNNIVGVMKGSFRNTFNGAITLMYTYKNVRFRNNLQISDGKSQESPYGSFADYSKLNPYWRAYDTDGNALRFLGDTGNSDFYNYWISLPTNPLYNATLNTFDKTGTSEIINNTSVEWTITNGLIFRSQFGITKRNVQTDVFRPADHTAFANYSVDDVFRKGDYRYGISNYLAYDGSANISYSKTFNTKHVVFGGLDFNVRQNKTYTYNFLAEGFPNPNFDFISMALQYSEGGKPSGSESLTRSVGFTGNANYTYDNRYFVDGSFRIDGASQFGSNKRFAPFWSVGLGWNLHNENFLQGNKFINRLKLRGSVGTTGSQSFNAYQSLSTYNYYTDDRYFSWLGSYLLGLGNEDLQWQQTTKYNLGTDAEFFNRHVRVTADVYKEITNGLISSVNLPASNGFTSYVENIGSIQNNGYELKVTGFVISKPAVTWSITTAIIHNQNKIIETSKAYQDAQTSIRNSATNVGQLFIPGYSSNTIWTVPSLGIDPSTGKELYLGADGQPTYTWNANNVSPTGVTDPKIFGNISTLFRYKNLSMNASFGYRFGGQAYNQTLIDRVETGNYKYNVDERVYTSRWQQPGDVTAFKGLLITGVTPKTSRFVQDENTFRLQNVNLQYDFRSAKFVKQMGIENLSIAGNMADVFYLSTIRRERGTGYPFSKQFSLTLNVTF